MPDGLESYPDAPFLVKKTRGESYKHAAARATVAEWIDQIQYASDHCPNMPEYCTLQLARTNMADLIGVAWRHNRNAQVEVPFIEGEDSLCDGGGCNAWDERGYERPPSYEQCIADGLDVAMIFDVAVYHKGYMRFAFEICHAHPVPEHKAERLREGRLPVFELDAEWVLRQVTRPLVWKYLRVWGYR
jgi:hypothetical protein